MRSLKAFPLTVNFPLPLSSSVFCREESKKKLIRPPATLSSLWDSLAFSKIRSLAAEGFSDESFTKAEKRCNVLRPPYPSKKTSLSFIPEDKDCLQQHVPPGLLSTDHLLTIQSFMMRWQGSSNRWGTRKELELSDPENLSNHSLSLHRSSRANSSLSSLPAQQIC